MLMVLSTRPHIDAQSADAIAPCRYEVISIVPGMVLDKSGHPLAAEPDSYGYAARYFWVDGDSIVRNVVVRFLVVQLPGSSLTSMPLLSLSCSPTPALFCLNRLPLELPRSQTAKSFSIGPS